MRTLWLLILILSSFISVGQKSFNDYVQVYPIGDDPNIRYMTSYTIQETILFEANPILRLSVYNNFVKGLLNGYNHTQAWYVSFRPALRMYEDNSKPVRTPSYRILLATQHLFRLKDTQPQRTPFIGFSLESGHYSNGQDGAAFSEKFTDGSKESDIIYGTINSSTNLSALLNRRSANFSTNMTELILNWRIYALDSDYVAAQMHSVNIGYVLYHNRFLGIADFGGYTPEDIRIYGRNRFLGSYEYMKVLEKCQDRRISVKQNIEYIYKPHSSVEPVRLETSFTFYPFPKSKAIGFLTSYIYGHDNYNYRFVDSGHQFSVGLTWSQFTPMKLK